MQSVRQGSIHLYRIAGVDLYLHWSWFLVAAYEIESRKGSYSSIAWNVLEYLALFLIVLLHEFGHAMACRQVGGTANQIVLWPLGGVAYVNPPQRPGATLWSIAAGPLVNVALLPVLYLAVANERIAGLGANAAQCLPFSASGLVDQRHFAGVQSAADLSAGWRADSSVAVVVCAGTRPQPDGYDGSGFGGHCGVCWRGLVDAFHLAGGDSSLHVDELLERIAARARVDTVRRLPRREGFACPSCRTAPPLGAYWQCAHCGQPFDTFEYRGVCPYCSAEFLLTTCLDCGEQHRLNEWMASSFSGNGAPTR